MSTPTAQGAASKSEYMIDDAPINPNPRDPFYSPSIVNYSSVPKSDLLGSTQGSNAFDIMNNKGGSPVQCGGYGQSQTSYEQTQGGLPQDRTTPSPGENKFNLEAIASRTDELLKNVESALTRSHELSSKIRQKSLGYQQTKGPNGLPRGETGNLVDKKPEEIVSAYSPSKSPEEKNNMRDSEARKELNKLGQELVARRPQASDDFLAYKREGLYETKRSTYDFLRNSGVNTGANENTGISSDDAIAKREEVLRQARELLKNRRPVSDSTSGISSTTLYSHSYKENTYISSSIRNLAETEGKDPLKLRIQGESVDSRVGMYNPGLVDKILNEVKTSSYNRQISPILNTSGTRKEESLVLETSKQDLGLKQSGLEFGYRIERDPVEQRGSVVNSSTTGYSYVQRQSPSGDMGIKAGYVPSSGYDQGLGNERTSPKTEEISKRVTSVIDDMMRKYFNDQSMSVGSTNNTVTHGNYTVPFREEEIKVEENLPKPRENDSPDSQHECSPEEYARHYELIYGSHDHHIEEISEPVVLEPKQEKTEEIPIIPQTKAVYLSKTEYVDPNASKISSKQEISVSEPSSQELSSDKKMKKLTLSKKSHEEIADLGREITPVKRIFNAGDLEEDQTAQVGSKESVDTYDAASVFDFEDVKLEEEPRVFKIEEKPPKPTMSKVGAKSVLRRDEDKIKGSKIAIWVVPKVDQGQKENRAIEANRESEEKGKTERIPLITHCFEKFQDTRLNFSGRKAGNV